MPELTGADVEELESLVELTRLRGWRVVKKLLSEHKEYCFNKAHACLEKFEDRKAGEWLAKAKDSMKILSLIQIRKQELTELQERSDK